MTASLRRLILRPREIRPDFTPFGWLSSAFTARATVAASTLFSFITLTTATFSAPFSRSLYFLRTNQERGLVFGLWGWCRGIDGFCTKPSLGYNRPPQLPTSLTKALVLYPIASMTVFAFTISYVPILRGTDTSAKITLSRCLGLASTFTTILAFGFMLAIFANAARELTDRCYSAEYGPLPTLSLLSIFLLSLGTLLTFRDRPSAEPRTMTSKDRGLEQHLTPATPRRARLSKVALPECLQRL